MKFVILMVIAGLSVSAPVSKACSAGAGKKFPTSCKLMQDEALIIAQLCDDTLYDISKITSMDVCTKSPWKDMVNNVAQTHIALVDTCDVAMQIKTCEAFKAIGTVLTKTANTPEKCMIKCPAKANVAAHECTAGGQYFVKPCKNMFDQTVIVSQLCNKKYAKPTMTTFTNMCSSFFRNGGDDSLVSNVALTHLGLKSDQCKVGVLDKMCDSYQSVMAPITSTDANLPSLCDVSCSAKTCSSGAGKKFPVSCQLMQDEALIIAQLCNDKLYDISKITSMDVCTESPWKDMVGNVAQTHIALVDTCDAAMQNKTCEAFKAIGTVSTKTANTPEKCMIDCPAKANVAAHECTAGKQYFVKPCKNMFDQTVIVSQLCNKKYAKPTMTTFTKMCSKYFRDGGDDSFVSSVALTHLGLKANQCKVGVLDKMCISFQNVMMPIPSTSASLSSSCDMSCLQWPAMIGRSSGAPTFAGMVLACLAVIGNH